MRILAVTLAGLTLTAIACVGDNPAETPAGGASSSSSGTSGTSTSSGGASSSGGGTSSSSSGDAGASSSGAPPPTCGTPGLPCCEGTTCSGGAACSSNLCSCPSGATACGDSCVDLQGDEANCGRCGRDCGAGTCNAGACTAVTILPGQRNVTDLVAHGDRYFWTRAVSGVSGGGFYSAKRDGSDVAPLHEGDATTSCSSLTVFQNTAHALCIDTQPAGRRILTCTLPACSDLTFRSAPAEAPALTADPDTGRLFYAKRTNYGDAPNGRVFELTANDSVPVGNANQANPGTPVLGGGFVYWLNAGTYASDQPQANSGVFRAALTTLGTQTTVADLSGQYFDVGGLTTDGTNVYFIGRSKFVNRTDVLFAPLTAGSATVFAQGQNANGVASDGTNVFFNDDITKELRTCPRVAGCNDAPTTLSTNEDDVGLVTTDETGVLWTKFTGEIRRIAKP